MNFGEPASRGRTRHVPPCPGRHPGPSCVIPNADRPVSTRPHRVGEMPSDAYLCCPSVTVNPLNNTMPVYGTAYRIRCRIPLFVAALLLRTTLVSGQSYPTYDPVWSSLDLRYTPLWYDEAKIGLLVYWGLPSVAAYADSSMATGVPPVRRPDFYGRALSSGESSSVRAFHRSRFGNHSSYRDFARLFRPRLFDPEAWSRLFKRAGIRYVVTTARLEDGYALWPSPVRPAWNSVSTGPRRDVVGDLLQASAGQGLYTGIYYTLSDPEHPLFRRDTNRWVETVLMPELMHLSDGYQPDILWTDSDTAWTSAQWKSESFLSWLYGESRVGPHVAVNDRWGRDARGRHAGFYTFPCNSTAYRDFHSRSRRDKWEACLVLGGSMGFNRLDAVDDIPTTLAVIRRLIDVVTLGGNLLLVIGPDEDGRIPPVVEERLSGLGDWLAVNGEAIYNTRPWRVHREGQNIWYVARGNVVYAILDRVPGPELVLDEPNPSHYSHFTVLGIAGELSWRRDGDTVRIQMPVIEPGVLSFEGPIVLKMTVIN